MKEKIRQYMVGRYGVDELSRFILMFDCVLMFFSFLIRSTVLNSICVLLIVICYIRMLSRNHSQRYRENQLFLKYSSVWFQNLNRFKQNSKQRMHYHIYKCPSCKQKIRVPRGKGKISITCPKCRNEFIKHS
ncbi:hypothetical protein [Konateibacter massiliensis]|uniref:hypothetical protein n=1 Tax=Konateibacter massiliensis TaxID=2002841 RepID=UPI001F27328D|nr:hypothetical protein [Konateibacter massiliensis]